MVKLLNIIFFVCQSIAHIMQDTETKKNEKLRLCTFLRTIHFLWDGKPIPVKYQNNINRMADNNPDYKVHN